MAFQYQVSTALYTEVSDTWPHDVEIWEYQTPPG